jgi:hypothetical protein
VQLGLKVGFGEGVYEESKDDVQSGNSSLGARYFLTVAGVVEVVE